MQTKRKHDENEGSGPGGGPARVLTRGAPVAPESAVEPLSIEHARLIEDFYVRGGASKFITPGNATPRDLARLGQAGLIELQQTCRNKDELRLSARGLQRLPEALKLIAADAKHGRGRGL